MSYDSSEQKTKHRHSYDSFRDVVVDDPSNPIEKCIICNKETFYRKNTAISLRYFYVQGCGQMCGSCHYDCYDAANTGC